MVEIIERAVLDVGAVVLAYGAALSVAWVGYQILLWMRRGE